MAGREGYDIAFACTDEKERKWLVFQRSLKSRIEESLRAEGLRTTRERSGFDVVVTGDIFKDARPYGDALLCFINHGTGIKTILYRLLDRHRDTRYIVFVEGEYRRRRIEEMGVRGSSEVVVAGYPKLDPVFRGELDGRAIMDRWKLDPARKTVLFAPTYKPTSIDQVGDRILAETTGYNLLIKLHHYSWRGRYAPHRHHRIYEKAVGSYDHARLVPPEEHNIIPFIHVADTMLSEASSTIFEFLALGKVGIIYDLECDRLKHHNGMPILDEDNRRFLDGAFIHIDNPGQIRAAVEKAVEPDEGTMQNVERYRRDLFYGLDGEASRRVVDKIEELVEVGD
jgi:CDP-glycerol glycerophosphotransferase (TagB/SpsB family)